MRSTTRRLATMTVAAGLALGAVAACDVDELPDDLDGDMNDLFEDDLEDDL
jgi:hypothetical protein